VDVRWYVVYWAGVIPLWLCRCWRWGGGVRMAIRRSIRVTSVGRIKKLYVRGNSSCVLTPILAETCCFINTNRTSCVLTYFAFYFKTGLFLINPLNSELNPICHLLALLGAHHILHVSRIRVK